MAVQWAQVGMVKEPRAADFFFDTVSGVAYLHNLSIDAGTDEKQTR